MKPDLLQDIESRLKRWFSAPPPSPLALAIFRIALGLVVMGDALERLPTAALFLSDGGFFPASLQSPYRPSLFNLFGNTGWPTLLLILYGLAGLGLVAGFRTRTAALLGWFLVLSLHHRNPYVTNGGDFLLRMTLLWSSFLPLAARLSVDRWMGRLGTIDFPVPAWSIYRLQVALVYLITAGHKLKSDLWRDGEALPRALNILDYQKGTAEFLAGYPAILPALGWLVIAVQIVAPFGLLARRRSLVLPSVAVLLGMQITVSLLFDLGLFPWMASTMLLPFLPIGDPAFRVVIWDGWRSWQSWACISIAAITFSYAVGSLVVPKGDSFYEDALQMAGLNQRWTMFNEPTDTSSRVAVLVKSGDRQIDLIALSWCGNGEIRNKPFAFPSIAHRFYESARWNNFMQPVAYQAFPGGRDSQRAVAKRIGHYFASRFPALSANGWKVVVFTRIWDKDGSKLTADHTSADDREVIFKWSPNTRSR